MGLLDFTPLTNKNIAVINENIKSEWMVGRGKKKKKGRGGCLILFL